MSSIYSNGLVTFTQGTRAAFSHYLREKPNIRRLSQDEKEIVVEWLTNPRRRPQSQTEHSRRHYVRKTFTWDSRHQTLLAIAKPHGDKNRIVITTDMIADTVEHVHSNNDHAGWDRTWDDIKTSYYGILREDVIFLLKQCQNQRCIQNPSKRPKGSAGTYNQFQQPNHDFNDYVDFGELQDDNIMFGGSENDMQGGENFDW